MYLSRLILNPRNAQARKEIALPYQLHRTLLNAFPSGRVEKPRGDADSLGVLFRLEQSERDGSIRVLVQSKVAPNWSFLQDKRDARGQPYLLPPVLLPNDLPNPAVTEFHLEDKLHAGQILAFRLRANPTRRLGKAAGKDQGKRVGIYDEAGQIRWLERKAEAGGFRILSLTVRRDGKLKDYIPRLDDAQPKLELNSVQFDGLLQVLDPQLLIATVENGVGSAKGFGFGLLSLARPESSVG